MIKQCNETEYAAFEFNQSYDRIIPFNQKYHTIIIIFEVLRDYILSQVNEKYLIVIIFIITIL